MNYVCEVLRSERGQKGFTLIELIIVMAILTILAAIAIPRFTGILHESKVKSDAITASGITNAARIQETSTGEPVISVNGYDGLRENYFEPGLLPSSGGEFTLSGGGNELYKVDWTPSVGIYTNIPQEVFEGKVFAIKTTT